MEEGDSSSTGDPLEGLLYDQANLEELCAERPLDWDEYAHMNEFHGNAIVIKQYAELPLDEPLPFAIEHAIPYDLSKAYEYDLQCGLSVYLAVREESAGIYQRAGMPVVHTIGSTYLYAKAWFRRLHPEVSEVKRRGTLVFPDKSTLLMDTDFDREAFAKRLVELPAEYQPVVVCTYWKDYVRQLHKPYEDAGLRVVSCGHLRDGQFLLRLHDLCRRFRYSCANDIAGSFVMSILSGCHFFYLPAGPLTQSKYGRVGTFERDPTLEKQRKAECLASAPFPPEDPTLQRSLVAHHAGVAHFRSVEAIRACYDDAVKGLGEKICPCHIGFGESTEVQLLYRLRPIGIDRDGWAGRRCSLRVANPAAIGGLRLKLELTHPSASERVRTEIYVDGTLICTLTAPPFSFELGIPLPTNGREVRIEFASNNDILLHNDPRRRAIRFCSIELVEPGTMVALELPAGAKVPKVKPVKKAPQKPVEKVSSVIRLGRRLRRFFSRPRA
jgi:hypothetical protein